jgi:creatinine amidohydrolase/Fe(II)-dependent formamide hydrolase-like protein
MVPYWSTLSRTGVRGGTTVATRKKGDTWLKTAVKGLKGIIRGFGELEIRERVDHH